MPADIIAFPAHRARPPIACAVPDPVVADAGTADAGTADAGQGRLRRALERLNAASTQQRQAVTGWRQALSDLQVSMRALDQRLTRYRDQLDQLQTDVTDLHGHAQRLERWASHAERRDFSTPGQQG